MKVMLKILGAAIVLLVVVVLVGSFVLQRYFTDERLRSLVLPPVREALGREVDFASCSVNILSGIKLDGLEIKEADGKNDFVTVKALSLGYSLWPLLHKRFEISRVRLKQPRINIWRDRAGHFNFESLKVLQKNRETVRAEPCRMVPSLAGVGGAADDPAAGMPLSLIVKSCEISDAGIHFRDQMGELPEADLKADFGGSVDLSRGLRPEDIVARGKLDFILTALYHELAPEARGRVEFDQRRIDYRIDVKLDREQCTLSGTLSQYLSKLPELVLNVDSPRLDLAYLAGLGEKLSATGKPAAATPTAAKKTPGVKPGAAPALIASGHVKIREAVYEAWRVDDFAFKYDYRNALLRITDLGGRLAGGGFAGAVALKSFPAKVDFDGEFNFSGLRLEGLLAMAAPRLQSPPSGLLRGEFKFSGHGRQPEVLKRNLTVVGKYGIEDLKVRNALSRELARRLQLEALNDLEIAVLEGDFRLIDGAINLNNKWHGRQLQGEAVGKVGLDGRLDLPLTLVLNRDLSGSLARRYAWVKETFNDKEEATVTFRLAGTLLSPAVSLDRGQLQKQLRKSLEKRVEKELFKRLDRSAGEKGDAGSAGGDSDTKQLLHQLLGK